MINEFVFRCRYGSVLLQQTPETTKAGESLYRMEILGPANGYCGGVTLPLRMLKNAIEYLEAKEESFIKTG